MTTLANTAAPASPALLRTLSFGLAGGAVGALVNVATFAVARLAGVDFVATFQPPAPPNQLPAAMVLIASVVPSLFASLLFYGAARFGQRGVTAFVAFAALFALLSLGGPFGLPDASLGTKLALDVMHVFSAIAIVGALLRSNIAAAKTV